MSARSLPPIYARLGERELPVRWAWYRPEPQVGDTVRLPTASNGNGGWQSFRVIGKRVETEVAPIEALIAAESSLGAMIHLDVEPIALGD